MKTNTILLTTLLSVSAIAFTANCSSRQDHASDNQENAKENNSESLTNSTDPNFQKQLATVFASYITLKDAFVASDAGKVKAAASETEKALKGVDIELLKAEERSEWLSQLSDIHQSVTSIQASDDIEVQRKTFSTLSDALYKSIKKFGLGGVNAYYEFCPMALEGGAYWLSNEEKIRNPYFGDKMLTCGMVKEKL